MVEQHVALRSPERVTKLVLIGSATTVRNDVVLALQREVNALMDPVPEQFVRDFQLSTIYKPLPEEFLNRVVSESLRLPARVWKEVVAGMLAGDASSDLNNIKTRTLVLWGEKETIFNRFEQDALMAALPNAVKMYPDTGHALHWERPQEFAKDLNHFIEGN